MDTQIWLREGALTDDAGKPAAQGRGHSHSASLGIAIDFHFYGDDEQLRHMRVMLHTDDDETAEQCQDLNLQTWVNALEVAVMLEGRPFHVPYLPGGQTFVTAMGCGDESSPALMAAQGRGHSGSCRDINIVFGMMLRSRHYEEVRAGRIVGPGVSRAPAHWSIWPR